MSPKLTHLKRKTADSSLAVHLPLYSSSLRTFAKGRRGPLGYWGKLDYHFPSLTPRVYATVHFGNSTSEKSVTKHCNTIQCDNTLSFSRYTICNMLCNILWQYAGTIAILDCANSLSILSGAVFLSFFLCVYLVFESCISLPAAYMFR